MKKGVDAVEITAGRYADRAKTYGHKRCKICKCILNKYNPHVYCFTHLRQGRLLEDKNR